ncbi:hypothetical protein CRV08_05900 [Halarcobacter ebronensis]|uniref:Uncharacterized protein n=1 Tax=Halarcobacter ebronensis TaxID=1462615 RepID=A0A4Q0YFH2_9BACT|nr:hypothetical protein [Halarcobacter ebronensis]RXJ68963.1 hypothetical protein CRV08_05900 [Halarcobacter ebronensis]
MPENICSICNGKFEDKYFDKEQKKCILHCEKNDWHANRETILGNIKICDDVKYNLFTEFFISRYTINNSTSLRIDKIHFPYNPIITLDALSCVIMSDKIKEIFLSECKFYGRQTILINQQESYQLDKMKFFNVFSDYEISFCSCKIKNLNISNCNIAKLEITFCEFNNLNIIGHFSPVDYRTIKNINFVKLEVKDNCWIKELDINELRVHAVRFSNTTFEKLNIKDKIDFDNSKFETRLDFYDIEYLDKLNLEKTLIPINCSFLLFSSNLNKKSIINVKNRETARIIKDSFEKQNNIIEANKYYALEMKEREKELKDDIKKGKNFFEYLVFLFHGLSSNHSQNWLLSLFWIFTFTFGHAVFSCYEFKSDFTFWIFIIAFSLVAFVIAILLNQYIDDKTTHATFIIVLSLIIYSAYGFFMDDFKLYTFSNKINPFSTMTEFSDLTFLTLLYKITIAYLIYQLIISIRQNTRRK